MQTIRKFAATLFFLLSGFFGYTQVMQPVAVASDTIREFEIIRGPSMRAIKIDSVTTLQTIAGGAVIKQGTTLFSSDSLVLNPTTHIIEAFGNIHINQADTIHTYGEYLRYLGTEKIAYIKKNVKLTDRKGTLLTDDLDYNLETGIGNFYNGGKVSENNTVITSVNGTYYADTKDIYFKKNVKLDDPKNHVRADSLLYNMATKKASFISDTHIKNDEVDINTTQGIYDLSTGNAFFTARTTVKDSSGRIYTANNIALENKSGNAQLEGNAIIVDSANNFIVSANQIFLNKKNNSFLATRKPVLIIKQKNDSTYIAADTIFSGITTFVEHEKMILQNDAVINVNPQQDQKVQLVEIIDSSERKLPPLTKVIEDSLTLIPHTEDSLTRRLQIKDSVSLINKPVILPDSAKVDTAHLKNKPVIPPDSINADTTQLNIIPSLKDTIVEKDTLIEPPLPDIILDDSTGNFRDHIIRDSSIKMDPLPKDSINNSDSATRYFLAFHHVRIFNDSLQSVSDSMFFSSKDSVFRLYKEPVIWSGETQITGDTIFLFTKNKQPERLYAFENGLIVNKTREGFYNQMAGKTINGYFKDGKIDFLRVKGSQAESIYYMQDEDSAYIGMNRATGDVIDLYFRNDELIKVLFINEISGNMYPMGQIPPDQVELKNFKWLDAKRPKNKLELFE